MLFFIYIVSQHIFILIKGCYCEYIFQKTYVIHIKYICEYIFNLFPRHFLNNI